MLNKQGKYIDTEAMNRQMLEIKEEVLGKTHPFTLITINNLALVLDRQGKYINAKAINRQTLKISEEVLGKTHPNTLTSVYCLVYLLQEKQEYKEVLLLYYKAYINYNLLLDSEYLITKAYINYYFIILNSLQESNKI